MTSTARRVHTVHYPETDHMGEDFLQRAIAEALRPLIARWFKSRRVKAFTGADQFLYWVEGDPTRRVAPGRLCAAEGGPRFGSDVVEVVGGGSAVVRVGDRLSRRG
jgi:hypothetical protein